MRRKDKKACRALNYFENFVFVSAISGCSSTSISTFASLVSVPVELILRVLQHK